MSRSIGEKGAMNGRKIQSTSYSNLLQAQKPKVVLESRNLTNLIFEGLDLSKEIESVDQQKLGDTIFLRDSNGELIGIAVCHTGARSEAGNGNCYVKFGAIRPGDNPDKLFIQLLNAIEQFARSRGLLRTIGGVNMGRHGAYRIMIEQGYRTDLQGVAMQKPNEPGYNLPDVYIIDDWR